jgi:hypothetical protein
LDYAAPLSPDSAASSLSDSSELVASSLEELSGLAAEDMLRQE